MRRFVLGLPIAALLCASPAFGQGAPNPPANAPAGETPSNAKAAEEHFKRARQLYDEGDFALALVEFQRAYELVPNYRVLYNIGQVNIQLFKYAPARVALEKYLKDGGAEITAQRKAQVEADLTMLRGRTAYLKVVTTPPAEVSLDDIPVGSAPFPEPLLINAGTHKVVVSHVGYSPATRLVTLAGGDTKDLTIELTHIGDPSNPVLVQAPQTSTAPHKNYTPAIAGWVATGALAVGAGVVGVLYLSKDAKLRDPAEDLTGSKGADVKSSAQTLAVVADVLGAAALIAGAISIYFTVKPPRSEPTTAATLQLLPGGVRGTF